MPFLFPLEINILEMIVHIDIIKESSFFRQDYWKRPFSLCCLEHIYMSNLVYFLSKKCFFDCTISFLASYSHLSSHCIFFF